ncbi:hypothetical protein BKA62DRAFT_129824 [Auriculariales sp. MPI-PUGE-AT-0066]|nr:hypothetical protein BKA62DRAFT_129824 [Auriculariales sp. MPI-PUGE-AT-0066]
MASTRVGTMHTLAYAEASEENPAPPRSPPPPQAEPRPVPRQAPTRRSRTLGWKYIFTIIAFHGIYAGFLYGYIRAEVYPLPRTAANRTNRGFSAFTAFMYIFGPVVAIFDTLVFGIVLTSVIRINKWGSWGKCCGFTLIGPLLFSFCAVLLFLGWIIARIKQGPAYAHACKNDWVEVLLTGHRYDAPAGRNSATFTLVNTGETLWTFTSSDPHERDFNVFALNSTAPSILPALGNITINEETNQLFGRCYGSTDVCSEGSVLPYGGLQFEVSYNGTISRSKNQYNDWSFQNVPSVIMHREDGDEKLGDRLLQTSIDDPSNCAQLKLCISHAAQRPDNLLSAEALVQTAWFLQKLALRATRCTKPHTN